MGRFTQDTTVFQTEDVLRDSYIPETLIEREEQENDFLEYLKPVINGDIPNNMFVYGQTGVGKTLSTRMMLDELKEDVSNTSGVSLKVLWTNCRDRTSYQSLVHLVNQFREPENQISKTGNSSSVVLDALWEEIEACDSTHVLFVLDEVDGLGNDPNILYEIPRARSNGNVENTKLGLIGISSNFTYTDHLKSDVQSSLRQEEIHFTPYSVSQLRNILGQRAEEAFYPGVVEESTLAYASAAAGRDTGSARHALDILRKAGQLARREESDSVTPDHAERAESLVQKDRIMDELRSLPAQSHLVLWALINLSDDGKTPARTKDIYDVYESVALAQGETVNSQRTVHNRLHDLSLGGFLSAQQVNKGEGGGKYNTYELQMQTETVKEVLEEETRVSGGESYTQTELN